MYKRSSLNYDFKNNANKHNSSQFVLECIGVFRVLWTICLRIMKIEKYQNLDKYKRWQIYSKQFSNSHQIRQFIFYRSSSQMYSNFRCRLISASGDVWLRVTGCVLEEAFWFRASLIHETTPIMTSNVGLKDSLEPNEGIIVHLQLLNVGKATNNQIWNMDLPGLGLVIDSSLDRMITILHG